MSGAFALLRLTVLALALALPTLARAEGATLRFGVFPNLPPRQLILTHQPLADALAARIGRPVRILSARDFRTFVARTHAGDYDLVLTAPHLAWLARREAGYRPLAKYREPVRGLLVARAGSGIARPRDLRGRRVAVPDPLAISAMAVEADLARAGLSLRGETRLQEGGAHTNAALRVLNGSADAAVIGRQPYARLPAQARARLIVLHETPPLSSQMLLAHPRLAPAEQERLQAALSGFAASPAGRAYLKNGGFGGFAPVDGNELAAFRPYAEQAARILGLAR